MPEEEKPEDEEEAPEDAQPPVAEEAAVEEAPTDVETTLSAGAETDTELHTEETTPQETETEITLPTETHQDVSPDVTSQEHSDVVPLSAEQIKPASPVASGFPLKEEARKELKTAEERATKIAELVEALRATITELSQKENATEEDASLLQLKHNELMKNLAELETVTKHIQDLMGLQNVSSSILGPPAPCVEPKFKDPCSVVEELKSFNLPKVIICGKEATNQIPKIIVCDPIDNNDPKKPIYQQIPGKPLQTMSSETVRPGGPCGSRGNQLGLGMTSRNFGMEHSGLYTDQLGDPSARGMLPGMGGMPPQMGGQASNMMGGQAGNMIGGQAGGMMIMQGQPQPGFPSTPPMMNPMMARQMQQMGQNFMGPPGAGPRFSTGLGMLGGTQQHMPDRDFQSPQKGMVEDMQKQLASMQEEMKKLKTENEELKKQASSASPRMPDKQPICKMSLSKTPVCKLDIYNQMGLPIPPPMAGANMPDAGKCKGVAKSGGPTCKMDMYRGMGIPQPGFGVGGDAGTKDVETMVASMEEEVRNIQQELDSVQAERRALEMQKKVLQCVAPSINKSGEKIDAGQSTALPQPQVTVTPPQLPPAGGGMLKADLEQRELIEKYNKLQENYNLKVEEVSLLRVELDNTRRESRLSIDRTKNAEARVDDLLERLKYSEAEEKKIKAMREQMIELEQQLVMAKQKYREVSEEVEGLKTELNDLKLQTDEYRNKYMKAQQTVEEQKNQLDMKNVETARYQEQFMLEFQRVKSQFQSKLEELTPYPEMLKKIQNKLREALHLKVLSEKNCMVLTKNLETANEEREKLRKSLDEITRNKSATEAEKANLQGNLTDGEKKMEETKSENIKLKAMNTRLEEQALKIERKYEEKVQEVLQLQSQLETLREESARQVSRTKDYCENVRKSLLAQISELEKQVASAKASAKLAQQDRDVIRQKMQAQITHLNDNFEQAQMRIRNLQSHVNYLKNSFTNMIAPVDIPFEKILAEEKR